MNETKSETNNQTKSESESGTVSEIEKKLFGDIPLGNGEREKGNWDGTPYPTVKEVFEKKLDEHRLKVHQIYNLPYIVKKGEEKEQRKKEFDSATYPVRKQIYDELNLELVKHLKSTGGYIGEFPSIDAEYIPGTWEKNSLEFSKEFISEYNATHHLQTEHKADDKLFRIEFRYDDGRLRNKSFGEDDFKKAMESIRISDEKIEKKKKKLGFAKKGLISALIGLALVLILIIALPPLIPILTAKISENVLYIAAIAFFLLFLLLSIYFPSKYFDGYMIGFGFAIAVFLFLAYGLYFSGLMDQGGMAILSDYGKWAFAAFFAAESLIFLIGMRRTQNAVAKLEAVREKKKDDLKALYDSLAPGILQIVLFHKLWDEFLKAEGAKVRYFDLWYNGVTNTLKEVRKLLGEE